MRQTKDSNVQWIGKIPVDWSVIAFWQSIDRISTGLNPRDNFVLTGDDDFYYVTIRNFKDGHLFLDEKCDRISEDAYKLIQKRSQLRKGDILFASITDKPNAYLIQSNPDNWNINESVFTIRFKHNIFDNKFFYYSITDGFYFDDLLLDATGSTFKSIKQNKLLTSKLTLPPISEQKLIAAFLDEQCGKIDSVIADVQAQIDTLEDYKKSVITEAVTKGLNPDVEMKDSGIDYIGNIPSGWDCDRGKYIFKYMQKPVLPDDDVITCFRDGEVTLRSNRREEGFTISEKEIGYQGIDVGDLIVHGMDGFAGAIGISDSRGKASPVLNVLETEYSKRYYMYFLRTMAYRGVFIALSTGIRVRTCDTNWGKLRDIYYAIPPKAEQEQIAKYLDQKIAETDSVIADKQAQIETLEAFKKSLIYEYVTGKKEVPAV